MAKESPKPQRAGVFRRSTTARRAALKPVRRAVDDRLLDALATPGLVSRLMLGVCVALACGAAIAVTRGLPLLTPGMIAPETRQVRVEFTIRDDERTEGDRNAARQRVPRVFRAEPAAFDQLRKASIELPIRAARGELERLTAEEEAALTAAASGEAAVAWAAAVDTLMSVLTRNPVLSAEDFTIARLQGTSTQIELRRGDQTVRVPRSQALSVAEAAALRESFRVFAARNAGFAEEAAAPLVRTLLCVLAPTYRYDREATDAAREEAAAAVQTRQVTRAVGETIFEAGEVITPAAYEKYRQELDRYRAGLAERGERFDAFARAIGSIAVAAVGVVFVGGYLTLFGPASARTLQRTGWIAGLGTAAVIAGCVAGVLFPGATAVATTLPPVLLTVLLLVGFDQRLSGLAGSVAAILISVGLDQPLPWVLVILLGVWVAVWRLPEIRDRRGIIVMSVWVGAALGAGALLLGLTQLPPGGGAWWALTKSVLYAALAGPLVGGVTLFVLPTVERAMGVATGMSLIELRDPKHPLLRELQRRAPGTYNHSLNVAAISEAAADAIGADSLLTYVGGLYHDIGKANKPDYFIENQSGGRSKHDKLSPAMSLLIIVGHVKDGVEMARAFGLPGVLMHFIEAHHGTTLVEYFFHRAKKRAAAKASKERAEGNGGKAAAEEQPAEARASTPEVGIGPKAQAALRVESESVSDAPAQSGGGAGNGGERDGSDGAAQSGEAKASAASLPGENADDSDAPRQPDEFSYRYPGPRPRTKEVAILMLADSVESAARSISEPTPSRIDALTRELANKRLIDGQFDECDLTLRELQTIVESLSRSVTSIYHGRIAYPSGDKPKPAADKPTDTGQQPPKGPAADPASPPSPQ